MLSDIEIAKRCKMQPIGAIAKKLGLGKATASARMSLILPSNSAAFS